MLARNEPTIPINIASTGLITAQAAENKMKQCVGDYAKIVQNVYWHEMVPLTLTHPPTHQIMVSTLRR